MPFGDRSADMVTPAQALPGSDTRPFPVPADHAVLGSPLEGPWPDGTEVLYVAMGCFWGTEKAFWQVPGVVTTAVGYQGGYTPNPTYEQVSTGLTGHAETVLVAYDPARVSAEALLVRFWEGHDPTQGFQQGKDRGTQYRSAVFWTTEEQRLAFEASRTRYVEALRAAGFGEITTQGLPAEQAGPFWYAEDYHQQYLHKNPDRRDPDRRTGVRCPTGTGVSTPERPLS